MTVDEIKVLINAETAPYRKAMEQVKSQTNAVSKVVNKFKVLIAGLAVGAGLFKLGKTSIQTALEVSASMNQIKRIMGESTQSFLKWAKNGALAFNMAESDALKYGAVYSNLFSNFIKDSEQLTGYTVKMLETSAVVASATGRSMDDVMNRIRSGMLGSTEAIEDLGINVNVSMIEATNAFKQFSNGQSWAQLDFNTQQAIRMMAILEQASTKYGDAVMQGPVSSLAYFVALLKDSALNIGNALLPVMQAIMPALSAFGQVLKTVTGYFAMFMQLLFGKTAETSGGVSELSNSIGGVASGLDNASNSAGGLGDAVGGVGKAAKQAKKELLGLMGFDEINSLNKNTSDSGSGGSGGSGSKGKGGGLVGGGIQLPKVSFSDAFSEQDNGPVLAFLEKFRTAIQPTIEALGRLQKALDPLKQFVYQGLVDFYQSFLVPVGQWVLGEGLPRFIDIISKTLNNIDFPKLNGAFKELWRALAPFTIEIGKGLLWFLDNVLSPLTSWTISDVVPLFLKVLKVAIETVTSTIKIFIPVIQTFFEVFIKPISSITGFAIIPVLDMLIGILDELTPLLGLFFGAWQITKIVSFIGQAGGLVAVINGITTALTTVIVAKATDIAQTAILTGMYAAETIAKWASVAATTALTAATWLLNTALTVLTSPITLVIGAIAGLIAIGYLLVTNWETVMDVAGNVWQWICDFIASVCKAIGDFFVGLWNGLVATFQNTGKWFTDMFRSAWNGIVGIFNVAVGWFGGIWKGITNVFSGVSNFFGGIFKGAWNTITGIFSSIPNWFSSVFSRAWAGVRDIFSTGGKIFAGITDGIANTFKRVVNAIIEGINNVIAVPFNAINRALDGIRGVNILGVSPFGWLPRIGVPKIPMLAKGGIVNSATLAVVGEAGTEAVMPLQRNTGWLDVMANKLVERMPKQSQQNGNRTQTIILQLQNGRELGRVVVDSINELQANSPYPVLNI